MTHNGEHDSTLPESLCEHLRLLASDPNVPVHFDPEEPWLYLDWGSEGRGQIGINFCFSCGSPGSANLREVTDDTVSIPDEKLRHLLDGVETVEQALDRLGPPDADIADGWTDPGSGIHVDEPRFGLFRTLTWSQLSDSLEVTLIDMGLNGIDLWVEPKPTRLCEHMRVMASDPDVPISFDPAERQFYLSCEGEARTDRITVRFCSSCGVSMPRSVERYVDVAAIPDENLRPLLAGVRAVEHALNRLGPPDAEFRGGRTYAAGDPYEPKHGPFRTLTWSKLSDSMEVTLIDMGSDGIQFLFWSEPDAEV